MTVTAVRKIYAVIGKCRLNRFVRKWYVVHNCKLLEKRYNFFQTFLHEFEIFYLRFQRIEQLRITEFVLKLDKRTNSVSFPGAIQLIGSGSRFTRV